MKKIQNWILFLIFGVFLLTVCKKPDTSLTSEKAADTSLKAVVVFSVGDSKISHPDGTEEKARLGVVVKMGDTIETGPKGKVDIQFESGSSIRIAPSSRIDFARLTMNTEGGQDTQLGISSGKLFADVKKSKKADSFTVVTPTAIAGVRGTKFIVEANPKTEKVMVKVLEGSVYAAPRIPAVESLSLEDSTNPELAKLTNALQSAEVVVDDGKSVILAARKEKLNAETIDSLDVAAAISTIEKEKPTVIAATFTKSEEQELNTIVKVDEQTSKEILTLNEKASQTDNEEKIAEIERKRKEIEEKLASLQEKKKKEFESSLASKPREFRTNKEIISYYEKIEKIQLSNGNTIIGAIINQEDGSIIVHTEKGIVRIPMDDVDTVIYDYQTRIKF